MSKNDFRSEFMEISKAIHFWKAYNVRSPKNNVYICAAPLTLVAMATNIWEFQHKISRIWGYMREITEHLAPNWGFTRLGNLTVSLKFNPDWPLLPRQRYFGNFKSKLAVTRLIQEMQPRTYARCTTKQGVFEIGQFNDVTEIIGI